MANSHDQMFQSPLNGNKYDFNPEQDITSAANMRNTTIKDETNRQNWLEGYKPDVYKKMKAFPDKIANGESIAIIQFQYDYLCNMYCEHCCIDKFYVPRNWEKSSGRRKFEMDDVRELSKQADEMGLANFVITGGEPLIMPDFDELVDAIDPSKFYLVTDSNGWNLDLKKAKHLKNIGLDKIQLSLDGKIGRAHV